MGSEEENENLKEDEISKEEEPNSNDGESTFIQEPSENQNETSQSGEDPSENEVIEQELLEFADFDSFDDLSEDDLADMKEAIEENIHGDQQTAEQIGQESEILIDQLNNSEEVTEEEKPEFKPEINAELEAKMQAELELKKRSQGIKEVSREELIEYLSTRRTKIVYHALWHLAFNVGEDYELSKQLLYEALKEVTSKNPVEPIEEHKFYFGLGFILRLKLGSEKIIQFKNGKLRIGINPKVLQEILLLIGDPISERPILTKREKQKMFEEFLDDDFLDI